MPVCLFFHQCLTSTRIPSVFYSPVPTLRFGRLRCWLFCYRRRVCRLTTTTVRRTTSGCCCMWATRGGDTTLLRMRFTHVYQYYGLLCLPYHAANAAFIHGSDDAVTVCSSGGRITTTRSSRYGAAPNLLRRNIFAAAHSPARCCCCCRLPCPIRCGKRDPRLHWQRTPLRCLLLFRLYLQPGVARRVLAIFTTHFVPYVCRAFGDIKFCATRVWLICVMPATRPLCYAPPAHNAAVAAADSLNLRFKTRIPGRTFRPPLPPPRCPTLHYPPNVQPPFG